MRAFLFKIDTGVLRVSHNFTNNLKIDIVDVGRHRCTEVDDIDSEVVNVEQCEKPFISTTLPYPTPIYRLYFTPYVRTVRVSFHALSAKYFVLPARVISRCKATFDNQRITYFGFK